MKKYITVFLVMLGCKIFPQFINNPSFENSTGQGRVPDGWKPCELNSTPDTQPGSYGNTLPASHGKTYASLVGRTVPAPTAGFTEDFETILLKPLKKGRCYLLKMDLTYSTTFFVDDFGTQYFFNNPMKLAVLGSVTQCNNTQTLAITSTVEPDHWQTYEYTLTPTADVTYLRLYSLYADTEKFCNMLIDNLQLNEIVAESIVEKDTLVRKNSHMKLDAGVGTDYDWTPKAGLTCTNCRETELTANGALTYTVSMQKGTDCAFYQKIFRIGILVKENIFIPNVITPNGDGFNDTFTIRPLLPNCALTIMNRLGEVLYKTDNYDNSWNGKYKDQLLTPDTYWYFFEFDKTEAAISGFIYLKQTE